MAPERRPGSGDRPLAERQTGDPSCLEPPCLDPDRPDPPLAAAMAAWQADGWLIDPAHLGALRRGWSHLRVIDVRQPEELEDLRLDGASNIPMEQILPRRDDVGGDDARPAVVFCRSGRRSLIVTMVLRVEGRSNVRSVRGGLVALLDRGDAADARSIERRGDIVGA